MVAEERSTIVQSRPRREAQLPLFLYRSVHLPSREVEIEEEAKHPPLYPRPWVEPQLPSSMPVCSTVVVGFLKLTKIQCFHEELLHYAVLVKVVINFKSADILQSYCSGLAFLISGIRFLLTQNKK